MIKKLKICTIILHSLIVIGAGHGIGIILMIDFASVPLALKSGIQDSVLAEFRENLVLVGLISVIGKIILISSLFVKREESKNLTGLVGLFFLWYSFYILASGNWKYDPLYALAFWTGLPFLICSIALLIFIVKSLNSEKANSEDK